MRVKKYTCLTIASVIPYCGPIRQPMIWIWVTGSAADTALHDSTNYQYQPQPPHRIHQFLLNFCTSCQSQINPVAQPVTVLPTRDILQRTHPGRLQMAAKLSHSPTRKKWLSEVPHHLRHHLHIDPQWKRCLNSLSLIGFLHCLLISINSILLVPEMQILEASKLIV